MSDFVQSFMERLTHEGLSPKSIRAYATDVRQYQCWLEDSEWSIPTASESTIREFAECLMDDQRNPAQCSQSTVYRKLVALRRFYVVLVDKGWSQVNPVSSDITRPFVPDPKLQTPILSEAEIASLLSVPDLSSPLGIRDRAMMVLMTVSHLDVHEVRDLDVCDTDLPERKLIATRADRVSRPILLPVPIIDDIRRWLNARSAFTGASSGALFIRLRSTAGGSPDGRLSCRGIRKAVDRNLIKAGLKAPRVSCKSLRASGMALVLSEGGSAVKLAEMIDASSRTVKAYERMADRLVGA